MNAVPQTKRKAGRRVVLWLCVALFLLFLAGSSFPGHGPRKRGCQFQSDIQMHQIAICIVLYSRDHGGAFPGRLSQLVPDYLPETRVFYFTCRYGTIFTPPNADNEPRLIDTFSPYSLLPLPDGRALVFERLPMWSDDTIGFQIVSNDMQPNEPLRHSRLPRDEFSRQYLHGFKQ
jgi:hypothetical protein